MTIGGFKGREGSLCLIKYITIFLFLAISVSIFALLNMDILEFQRTVRPPIPSTRNFTKPKINHNFCTFKPLIPKEDLEELLDSITWPETPQLASPVSLEQTTDPAHSTFRILPGTTGGRWHVGDELTIRIKMYDFQGLPKKSGGDVLVARLHNPALGAGVAGQVVDHLNGSYSALFALLWEGNAQVEVTLVHPSEAVTVLRGLTKEQPDRINFQSLFRSGSVSQTTTCNICLHAAEKPVCNYTDLHTGEPWFCYKPSKLSCDARINHSKGNYKQNLKDKEDKLFQRGVNMKVSIRATGPSNVTVLPIKKGQQQKKHGNVKSRLSGYYYQNVWRALGSTTVRQFRNSSAIRQCLKDKVVNFYGDSTIRQWFEHLRMAVPELQEFNLHSLKQTGPFLALDFENNIMVRYRCHGPPIRFANTPASELRYIANELDGLIGGPNTVVVIGIWSHFSTFPIEVYIRRLQSIRRAVVRLLDRGPGTLVVIRTANLKDLTLYEALTNSDWYSLQRDMVLRAMFKGLDVQLVDAWEMSLAHHLPHSLHPQPPIIKNMMDVLLSYICPYKGG
ncbi:uncharacterized protein V6R79_012720 [Siganus canaliculatus]